MKLDTLVLSYIADIDRELVVLQGISAQITRARQPLSPTLGPRRRRKSGLEMMPKYISRPGAPAALKTHVDSWGATQYDTTTRPRINSRDGGSMSPSIPLHLLLPRSPTNLTSPLPLQRTASAPGHGMVSPPMSPGAASTSSRFSDAHIEYIGRDCVIHNGAQMVDIAMEYAAQRAAPRMVNIPHGA
ncbi:hypothetical protein LPJ61_000144 [Coemansia biformis]|uniref:Uncharacterized protein n=1 Tax=Coemansia biformis TaxID=1286918 RepID=A0A9W7YHN7_9FUNG|nr:hypothetical protein LPJ61_000144 [Coemansia biformis]